MIKYIFCFVDRDENGLFRDLTSEENSHLIDFLPSHKVYSKKIISFVEKTALSYSLNMRFEVPFQSIFYNLENYNYNSTDIYRILMPTTSISKFSLRYLEQFKAKHRNVELYAILTDSMNASSLHLNLVRKKLFSDVWTAILTYDLNDAREHGFEYFGFICYSSFDDIQPDDTTSDIYYVGFDKGGRRETVELVYRYLSGKCNCRFDVVTNDKKIMNRTDTMPYLNQKIPYPTVVARVKSTNCILEILQENQQTHTLRWFEAIAYNKKLLTNNKNIASLPYYNPDTMRYFDSIEDIDIDWVRKEETIDYGYHGEYSPIYLIDYIDELNNQTGR